MPEPLTDDQLHRIDAWASSRSLEEMADGIGGTAEETIRSLVAEIRRLRGPADPFDAAAYRVWKCWNPGPHPAWDDLEPAVKEECRETLKRIIADPERLKNSDSALIASMRPAVDETIAIVSEYDRARGDLDTGRWEQGGDELSGLYLIPSPNPSLRPAAWMADHPEQGIVGPTGHLTPDDYEALARIIRHHEDHPHA